MGERVPGVLGDEPPVAGDLAGSARNGQFSPGVTGTDEPVEVDTVQRTVTAVTKDWEPPKPKSDPPISVSGKTLADVAQALKKMPGEKGRGGGFLRMDAVPVGVSESVTVSLHANLVFALPTWTGYSAASAAAQAEWDRMMVKLRAHEQRHLDIAIEEANNCARDLIGGKVGKLLPVVDAANVVMKTRQDSLDTQTEHGTKAGVQYGDVILDTSIQ